MNITTWTTVQQLFEDALKHPPDARYSYISKKCQDEKILQGVESLLATHTVLPEDFLEPVSADFEVVDHEDSVNLIGTSIGEYHILELIAQGGMGTVFLAKQKVPSRTVAIKIISLGNWSTSARHRFEFESQVLGQLSHPHIAQVYEVGTHDDVPFFVMEYVPDGSPITQYVQHHELNIRDRLLLFLDVCDAVQHGHQKGVIHRDLKPGNILVDSEGHLKVIDFGVARSTDSDIAVTTIHTNVGQLIGTLQYMSPEQCEARPFEIDVRSDVYSLGVVLYQLLCGEPPYDVSQISIASAARVICEQEPIRPRMLHRKLRGDLELILLKAIEKDRERRYQSAADLARDIRHFLAHEPIEARPPTLWSRCLRFAARHPIVMTTVTSIFIAASIILGTFLSLRWAEKAPQELVYTENKSKVSLISVTGHIIHSWDAEPRVSIRKGVYFNTNDNHNSRRLVILGYGNRHIGPLRGSLAVYDIDQSFETPIWTDKMRQEDIPFTKRKSGFAAADFGVYKCDTIEVFEENPGPEIIAFFSHLYSRRVIRIYNLDGKLLYQMWHDGVINSYYMMRKAGLLVLTGENAEAYWEDRGYPDIEERHPHVVFALRPRIGLIINEYLKTEPGESDLHPAWYKCLLPPKSADVFNMPTIFTPDLSNYDDGYHVMFSISYRNELSTNINYLLDQHGEVVPGAHTLNDAYHRNPNLPRMENFYLGPLPPIVK